MSYNIPPVQAELVSPPQTSNKAIISLVLGILSFFCSIVAGIPAIILGILANRDINRSRGTLTGSGMAIAGVVMGAITSLLMPILVAMMFPAIGSVIDAVRALQSTEQLSTIGRAITTFDTMNASYPADSYDAAGNPLLSWRVHILPHLDERELYSQFHLNEPWDSPHNRSLISKMPRVYRINDAPETSHQEKTAYLALIQAGGPFDGAPGDERGVRKRPEFLDNVASQLIMVVEVDEGHEVEWTRPADLPVDLASRRAALRGRRTGGDYLALYADGHVSRVAGFKE
jgi:hypothetical protein